MHIFKQIPVNKKITIYVFLVEDTLHCNLDCLNTEVLLDARKENVLEENANKSKFISRHQSAEQNHNINTANKSYQNVLKCGKIQILGDDNNKSNSHSRRN